MIEFKTLEEAERRMAELEQFCRQRRDVQIAAGALQPVVVAIRLCLSEIRDLKSRSPQPPGQAASEAQA